MNIFRILADLSHALSKCILIWAIHSNSSSEGVSLLTQAFYSLVFLTRYMDYFRSFTNSAWNTSFKTFYILSSFYVLFLMLFVYARTREREKAWKLGALCLGVSAAGAPIVMLIFRRSWVGFEELCWIFSTMLESVCVLPQLLLLRQTTVPTVIDSYYLLTLGVYRGLYILNWIIRELDINDRKPDPVAVIFGVIQTAFYIDFAWVYYSRQRVKLRHGGLVDQDDLRNGWFLGRLFGNKRVVGDANEDEESRPALDSDGLPVPNRTGASRWGSRGISVSADDSVLQNEHQRQQGYDGQEDGIIDTVQEGDEDAQLKDPDELAGILEDEDDDGDNNLPSARVEGVGNGNEWREGR